MNTYHDCDYTHSDAEFSEMSRLLAETNARGGRPGMNWTFARLENWRFASWDRSPGEFRDMVHLWRDESGALAGFTIFERLDSGSDVELQVRPDCRDVEPAMLDWLETRYGDQRELTVTCFAEDDCRAELLRSRGYREAAAITNFRAYEVGRPRPSVPLPPGYRLSDLCEFRDAAVYARLEATAFDNDSIDEQWYRGKSRSPHYDPRLHVIVLSPDGEPVSVAHAWMEGEFGTAEIDPVATHPDHRRLHLAEAAITEALNRLSICGARVAWIAGGAEPYPSNRLYERLEPAGLWSQHRWVKKPA